MSDTNRKRKSTSMIPKLNTAERQKSSPENINSQLQPSSDVYKRISPTRAQFESKKLQSACMFMKLLKENIDNTNNKNKGPENNAISDLLGAIFDLSDSLTPIVNTVSKTSYSSSDFQNSYSDSTISEQHFNNTMKATSRFFEVTKKSTLHTEWNDQSYYYAQQIIANNMEESNLITRSLREIGDRIYIDKSLYYQLIDLHNLLNDTIIKLKNREREVNAKAFKGSQQTYTVKTETTPYNESEFPESNSAPNESWQHTDNTNATTSEVTPTHSSNEDFLSKSSGTKGKAQEEDSNPNDPDVSGEKIQEEPYNEDDLKSDGNTQEEDYPEEHITSVSTKTIKEEPYSDEDLKTDWIKELEEHPDLQIKSESSIKKESESSIHSEIKKEPMETSGRSAPDSRHRSKTQGSNTPHFADECVCTCDDEDATPKKARFYDRANIQPFRKLRTLANYKEGQPGKGKNDTKQGQPAKGKNDKKQGQPVKDKDDTKQGQPVKDKDDTKQGLLSKIQKTVRSQVKKPEIMKRFSTKDKPSNNAMSCANNACCRDCSYMRNAPNSKKISWRGGTAGGSAGESAGGSAGSQNIAGNRQLYLDSIEKLNEMKMCLESAVYNGVDISDRMKFAVDDTRRIEDCSRFHTTIDKRAIVMMFTEDRKIRPTTASSKNHGRHVSENDKKTSTSSAKYDVYLNRRKKHVDSIYFNVKNSDKTDETKTNYNDSDSSPDIPYIADNASLPKIEVPSNFCSSLDIDVKTIASTLRDNGIYHPDGNVLKSLMHFPINDIIESCRPAKCCRKTVLNGRPRGNMPYAASLKSLPLVNVDIERVKQIIESNVKFNTYPTYPIFEHYINFQKNVINHKFACSIPTPLFEVRFFEIFKKEEHKDNGESGTKTSTHDMKILDFIRRIYTSEPVPQKRTREHRDKEIRHHHHHHHHHKHRKHRKLETKRCRVESYLPPQPNFLATSSSSFLPSTVSLPPAIRKAGNESMQSFLLIPRNELSTYFSGEMSTTYSASANSLPLEDVDIRRNLSRVLSAIRFESHNGDDIDDSSLTPGNYAETLDAIYELDENGKMRPKSINLLKPQTYWSQPNKENVNLLKVQSSLSTIHESEEKGRRKESDDEKEQEELAPHPRYLTYMAPMEGSEMTSVLQHLNTNEYQQPTLNKHKVLGNVNNTCFDQKGPVYQQAFGIGPVNKLLTSKTCNDDSEEAEVKNFYVEISTDESSPKVAGKKQKAKTTLDNKLDKVALPSSKRSSKHKRKTNPDNIKGVNDNGKQKNIMKEEDLVIKTAEPLATPPHTVDKTQSKFPRDQKIQIENNVVAYVIDANDPNTVQNKKSTKQSADGTSTNVCSWPPPVKKPLHEVTHIRNKNAFFVSVHQNELGTNVKAQDLTSKQQAGQLVNNDAQTPQDVCKMCGRNLADFATEINDKVTQFPECEEKCKLCLSNLDNKKYKVTNLSQDNFVIGYIGSQTECKGILKDSIIPTDSKDISKKMPNKRKKVKHATPEVIDIKMAKKVKSTILQHSFYNGHDRPGYVTVLKTPCNCPDITIFIPCYCGNYKCIKSPPPYERINDYAMIPITEQSDVSEGKKL